jgi:hypothetical protein
MLLFRQLLMIDWCRESSARSVSSDQMTLAPFPWLAAAFAGEQIWACCRIRCDVQQSEVELAIPNPSEQLAAAAHEALSGFLNLMNEVSREIPWLAWERESH